MKNKTILTYIFILALLMSFSLISAQGSYARSVPAYSYGGQTSALLTNQIYPTFDTSACYGRQDFIVQVDPTGCINSPVRSDLLEEQPVSVFCPIVATQLNPLININAINHMTISLGNVSKEVMTVGYQPAQAALGQYNPVAPTSFLGNIGYATIVLRQQPNESAMPDFVQGNLTARMSYDVNKAFGVGNAVYYLPELTDDEFNQNINAYSFWNGKGYLRLDGSDNNGATISVYSGMSNAASPSTAKTKIGTFTLKEGEKSSQVYLPGFSFCMGGLNVQLQDMENPDTIAKLTVDSDVIEAREGETFLEGKCTINTITKRGMTQNVKISCNEDQRKNTFILGISPKVTLTIGTVTKEYGAGDKLFDYTDSQGRETSVYLAFVGNSGKINSEKNIYIRTLIIPQNRGGLETNLTNEEIAAVASYDKALVGSDLKYEGPVGKIIDLTNLILATLGQGAKGILNGKLVNTLKYSTTPTSFLGQNVQIVGYAGVYDADLSQLPSDTMASYTNAMNDYQTIIQSFAAETYPEQASQTKGQEALIGAIQLADHFQQKKTAQQLCQQYLQYYGATADPICNDQALLSSTQVSQQSVVINGHTHVISFNSVTEPSFEEYGVQLSVQYPNGEVQPAELQKNGILYLNDKTGEYIQLTDLSADTATFTTNLIVSGAQKFITIPTQRLKLNSQDNFGSQYSFAIQKINIQKVAKVSVIPNLNFAQSNATFNFKIGIEKRGIQLSPQQTKDRISSLNSTIKKLSDIQSTLNKVVTVGKAACLVTEGTLLVKNFILNLGGTGSARQAVMRNTGGWYDKCDAMVKAGQYTTIDNCLLDHSSEVDASVKAYDTEFQNQNQNIEQQSQGLPTTTILGEKVPDTNALLNTMLPTVKSNLANQLNGVYPGNKIKIGTQDVLISDIIPRITSNTATLTQIENLQLNVGLLGSSDPTVAAIAKNQVQSILGQIYSNSNLDAQIQSLSSQYGIDVQAGSGEKLTDVSITSINTFSQVKNKFPGVSIPDNTYVMIYHEKVSGRDYLVTMTNTFIITETYLIGADYSLTVVNEENVNPLRLNPTRIDSSTYQNPYQNAQVQYYETGQYAGLPAIVPFDLKAGWYAAIKSNLPILGGLTSYDASGRVSSFYVCNVGSNGREESMAGDDICGQFVPGTNQPPVFQGLSPSQAQVLMTKAVDAISAASKAHKTGVSYVTINNQKINVGPPAANTPNIQCQDFMSPSDCNILFNVCDPVVCPSSRCNLGGAYPVQDVIQSGVIGSLALCLPNYPQIKVPICVSGVNAGLQGYISVLKSYQQCLQTSLNTGQTVGICDEVNSVYMCQFFWKQGIPLINYALPKITGSIFGKGSSSGGGEYLAGSDALTNAQNSIDYFSQYYAANSYKAFQERSTQSVGDELCKNFISLTTPGGDLFDTLVAPDSPSQFYAQFDEIPYTTATNPPTSQYKVFYHIYAGTDFPAYYQVYLKASGTSFYQDTATSRLVATGFIPAGDFKTDTVDFTAPSGYQQLCIVVNGKEQCGFKQVTTEFGINSIKDQYLAQQSAQTDITTEAACVSGTPSAYSLLNPNVQAGATNTINPAIYNQGIIRICSTGNPGQATDANLNTENSRWQQVGYCGTQNLKCWLDTQSVTNVIKNQNVLNSTLNTVSSQYIQTLNQQGVFLDDAGFSSLLSQIKTLNGQDAQLISLITPNIQRAQFNNQKAQLYYLRGGSYSSIAKQSFDTFVAQHPIATSNGNANKIINPNGFVDGAHCTYGYECQSNYCDPFETICAQNPDTGTETGQTPTTGATTPTPTGTETFSVTYPIFDFSDGSLASGDLLYTFYQNDWYWCSKSTDCSTGINKWKIAGNPGTSTSLSEKNLNFLTSLGTAHTYAGGLLLLMQRTTQNQETGFLEGVFDSVKLSTTNVDFTPDRIYTVHRANEYDISFTYDQTQKKWQWSFNKQNPLSSWAYVPTTSIGGQSPSQDNINLLQSLASTIEINGAETIFGVNAQYSVGTQPSGTGNAITCTDDTSCQVALGNRIIQLATQLQQSKGNPSFMSDAIVQQDTGGQDTGAKSFVCLALQIAMTESSIHQCGSFTDHYINFQQGGNPLYCEGHSDQIVSNTKDETSLGIMQINVALKNGKYGHCGELGLSPTLSECKTQLSYLSNNVNIALNLLVNAYNPDPEGLNYNCYRQVSSPIVRTTDFVTHNYKGWERAIRAYNGWNSLCTVIDPDTGDLKVNGNPYYVSDVEAKKSAVAALFPQCA